MVFASAEGQLGSAGKQSGRMRHQFRFLSIHFLQLWGLIPNCNGLLLNTVVITRRPTAYEACLQRNSRRSTEQFPLSSFALEHLPGMYHKKRYLDLLLRRTG